MRRGDICLVDLEPVRGSEANKRRPAVVVSNDGANAVAARRGQGVVTVAPLTSNVERVRPFQVLVTADHSGLYRDSKVQAEQIRSVDVVRLSRPVGRVSSEVMIEVDAAVRLHLGL